MAFAPCCRRCSEVTAPWPRPDTASPHFRVSASIRPSFILRRERLPPSAHVCDTPPASHAYGRDGRERRKRRKPEVRRCQAPPEPNTPEESTSPRTTPNLRLQPACGISALQIASACPETRMPVLRLLSAEYPKFLAHVCLGEPIPTIDTFSIRKRSSIRHCGVTTSFCDRVTDRSTG
jgi:hypothetical protein